MATDECPPSGAFALVVIIGAAVLPTVYLEPASAVVGASHAVRTGQGVPHSAQRFTASAGRAPIV